jgi:hypothetical protein
MGVAAPAAIAVARKVNRIEFAAQTPPGEEAMELPP